MKLKNKETGEIVDATMPIKGGDGWAINASSLAELNDEWEDYEEPAPKRYRLKKDLPTFKAGDTFHLEDGSLYLDDDCTIGSNHWTKHVMAYHKCTLEKFPNILKDWFEPVGDTNAEPLGEGKKIRKALRAWAEANSVEAIRVVSVNKTLLRFTGMGKSEYYYIDIEFSVDSTDRYEDSCDGEYRSLPELFGEEEE